MNVSESRFQSFEFFRVYHTWFGMEQVVLAVEMHILSYFLDVVWSAHRDVVYQTRQC